MKTLFEALEHARTVVTDRDAEHIEGVIAVEEDQLSFIGRLRNDNVWDLEFGDEVGEWCEENETYALTEDDLKQTLTDIVIEDLQDDAIQ